MTGNLTKDCTASRNMLFYGITSSGNTAKHHHNQRNQRQKNQRLNDTTSTTTITTTKGFPTNLSSDMLKWKYNSDNSRIYLSPNQNFNNNCNNEDYEDETHNTQVGV